MEQINGIQKPGCCHKLTINGLGLTITLWFSQATSLSEYYTIICPFLCGNVIDNQVYHKTIRKGFFPCFFKYQCGDHHHKKKLLILVDATLPLPLCIRIYIYKWLTGEMKVNGLTGVMKVSRLTGMMGVSRSMGVTGGLILTKLYLRSISSPILHSPYRVLH